MNLSLEEALKFLQNHQHFAVFIKTIHLLREEAISELHNASSDSIQQISGRIITYDQILQMSNWDKLRDIHKEYIS